jgi:hypothetical protein
MDNIKLLLQSIDIAQRHGAYLLSECEVLKKCRDSLTGSSQEVDTPQAKQLLIQAVVKGQAKGAYTLDEAAAIHAACAYILEDLNKPPTNPISSTPDSGLSELSAPVPLKPREI